MRTQEKTQNRQLSALQLRKLQQASQKYEAGLSSVPYCQIAMHRIERHRESSAQERTRLLKGRPMASGTGVQERKSSDCQAYLAAVIQRVATMS